MQRRFGRRTWVCGGQQERTVWVRAQCCRLEDEVEIADERVVEPVSARCRGGRAGEGPGPGAVVPPRRRGRDRRRAGGGTGVGPLPGGARRAGPRRLGTRRLSAI